MGGAYLATSFNIKSEIDAVVAANQKTDLFFYIIKVCACCVRVCASMRASASVCAFRCVCACARACATVHKAN